MTKYYVTIIAISQLLNVSLAIGSDAAVDAVSVSARIVELSGPDARVEVKLTNVSNKTVTAWAYSVEGRYPDGSSRSTFAMVDEVSSLLGASLPVPKGDREPAEFRSGILRTRLSRLPLSKRGEFPTSVTAVVEMVALDDGTAQGDIVRIRQLSGARRSMAASISSVLADIQRARESTDPKASLRATIEKLSKDTTGPRQGGLMLQQLMPLLDQEPVSLDRALAAYKAYRDLLNQHSDLKEAN